MKSIRFGARLVVAIYTLLPLFTTCVAAAGSDSRASIEGTVTNFLTGERLRKAYVRLLPASGAAHLRPAVTDDQGRFTFKDLPPGSYSIEAEHPGFIETGYGDIAGARMELKLAPDQNLSGLNIGLMPPAAVSGHVKDEDGDPWTHVNVGVFRSSWERGKRKLQGFSSAEVDDSGSFRAGHLPPGRYYLSAEPEASWEARNRGASAPRLQPTWYPDSLDSSAAAPVVLLPGQELTGIEIRLRRSSVYRIRGKVSGLQGIAVLPGPGPWMTPRLVASSAPGMTGATRGGSLKQDGAVEVNGLVPGTWEIRVEQ